VGKQRIALDREEQEHENLAKTGVVLTWHVTISSLAAELRLLVRDAGSESLGSRAIPVPALLEGAGMGASPPAGNTANGFDWCSMVDPGALK
jgi:hypothetical protein